MELVKKPNECAFQINSGDYCVEDHIIDELKKFVVNIKNIKSNKTDVIGTLKEIYNCKTESCILTNTEVINHIGNDVINEQLDKRFKPEGPHDSMDWFSNVNIDAVLSQIEIKYKHKNFLHICFQMRDFEAKGWSLARTDLAKEYNKGTRCFGVVFNTDYSTGRGQHWFAIFGDFNKAPFTIEYFNSSGDEPLPEITTWMKKTKHHLEKKLDTKCNDIITTKIRNQYDNHSCGSYSLYYIISRLEGIPYSYFANNKIGDENMHIFRKYHLFRQPN